ncbi:MAG: metallophosphoesterase [Kiritimatiellae bacterium]|nr:metallophosphoesterase [Kiritimatiellia bacterium]
MMDTTRREFFKGMMAAAGLTSFGTRRVFAAPDGWTPPRPPNITFGVVSDTHLRTDRTGKKIDMRNWPDKYLVAAFRHFHDINVDAVVHCGDMADRGQIVEMQAHATAWRKAFPDDRAADGRKVEKLFVMGNHDVDGYDYGRGFRVDQIYHDPEELKKHILLTDLAGWWERIWGEKYEPVWHKEVKGYHFFGLHWGVDEMELDRLIASECASCALDVGDKPFFFLSHAITHTEFNKAVRAYRNGFGFFGHWHMSAANWKVLHLLEGVTPSVQCPAIYPYFNDGKWLGGGDRGISVAPIEDELQAGSWRQGLVIRVYDDMLVISRHEYSKGGSLGQDWIMPLKKQKLHPLSLTAMKKKIGSPQFRADAKLCVEAVGKEGERALKLSIPPADGNPDSRVYAFDVIVTGDDPEKKLLKSVYAAGANMGVGHEPNGGVTVFKIPVAELPKGENLTITVRPITSLGTHGRTIAQSVHRGAQGGTSRRQTHHLPH